MLAHAARLVAVGAAAAPREVQEARQAAALIGDLKFIVATQEKPTEFSIHAAASGLPNVPHIFQAYMQQMQGRPRAVRAPNRPGFRNRHGGSRSNRRLFRSSRY